MQTFLVFREWGQNYVSGKSSREQPHWEAHAGFMDQLFQQGHIVMAGPYADASKVLMVVRADSSEEAVQLFESDIWTTEKILGAGEAHEWLVFMDSATGRHAQV